MHGGGEGGEMRVGTRERGEKRGGNSSGGGGRQWSGDGNGVVLGQGKGEPIFLAKNSPYSYLVPVLPCFLPSTHGWEKNQN